MFFLSSLFKEKKVILQDDIFGFLTVLKVTGDCIIWQGKVTFLNTTVSLFISGTKTHLNNKGRVLLIDFLSNQPDQETVINAALKKVYNKTDFSSWHNHFNCLSIFAKDDETEIIFQEKKSFKQVTICFSGSQLSNVLIDS